MKLNRALALLLAVLTVFSTVSCSKEPEKNDDPTPSEAYLAAEEKLAQRDVAYVTMEIEGIGDIKLALDATAAPNTVRHFLKLVNEGFYDGLSFYAAIEDFVIQGGDPDFDANGVYKDDNGNPVCIEGEFLYNGYQGNDIKHERGVISMIRWNPADSASCQFFICNATNESVSSIDGYYAAFGYVMDGMDVVDKITESGENANVQTQIIPKDKQIKIKRVYVNGEVDLDLDEVQHLKSGECEYVTRDVTGRDIVYVEITFKGYGTVKLLLDRTTAPITVDNFVSLVNAGFYDGLTIHRSIENFMIQGGDPDGDGTGGNTDSEGNKLEIKGEFSSNGWENDILHKRGVISMARAEDPDSASSQFFIMNADATHLDGSYAAFGYVVEGLRVIDAVTRGSALYGDSNGMLYSKAYCPVIESVRVVEN